MSESDRRRFYADLEQALGTVSADDLMTLLPQQPTPELVTHDDLRATTAVLQGEMAELRGDMAELRSELRGEMAELRSELRGEMAELGTDLRREMNELRLTAQRWMSGAMAVNTVALISAIVT